MLQLVVIDHPWQQYPLATVVQVHTITYSAMHVLIIVYFMLQLVAVLIFLHDIKKQLLCDFQHDYVV